MVPRTRNLYLYLNSYQFEIKYLEHFERHINGNEIHYTDPPITIN
jgi:hypothetical protein